MGKRLKNLSKKKDLMKPIIYLVYSMESDNFDIMCSLEKNVKIMGYVKMLDFDPRVSTSENRCKISENFHDVSIPKCQEACQNVRKFGILKI